MTNDELRALADPEAEPVFKPPQEFMQWVRDNMPPGMVVGDPEWWAPRLWRAAMRAKLRAGGFSRHPDDVAVDRFALGMKYKLAVKRAEGRGGWDDPAQCTTKHLAELLRDHIAKGDPLDVGNFAMMLWNRGGSTNEGIL